MDIKYGWIVSDLAGAHPWECDFMRSYLQHVIGWLPFVDILTIY